MADKKRNFDLNLDMDLAKPLRDVMTTKGDVNVGLEGLDPIKRGQENLRDAGERSRRKAIARRNKRR